IEDPIFAEAQKERFERLEAEVRLNTEAQREAYRAARRAAREGLDLSDFDGDDDDGVEVVYVP
ncbi:MAG: GTPase ObgE, partial [Psychrobacter sp.]|nr:GTPase ObgE [Psychrobacter sp.]